MRKWVFVHIPKTAGTSFQNALREILGYDSVSPSFNASKLSEADAERLDQYKVISGHISMADVTRYFPNRYILTILRNPLERCVSWYYFARMTPPVVDTPSDVFAAQQNTIEAFFAQDERVIYRNIFNRQVRQLGDHVLNLDASHREALDRAKETLRSAAWVGRQERLAEDIARLTNIFPEWAGLSLEKLNRTEGRASIDDLSADVINRIESLNIYDNDLYAYAGQRIRFLGSMRT